MPTNMSTNETAHSIWPDTDRIILPEELIATPSALPCYTGDLLLRLLHTPHWEKRRSHNGMVRLDEAIGIAETKERLAGARGESSEAYDAVRVTEAQRLSRLVNDALLYSSASDCIVTKRAAVLDTEQAIGLQTTNCFGYSIVLSRCLEAVGIQHYVGCVNNHSFALLPIGRNRDQAWMIDALEPWFSQEITHVAGNVAWGDIATQVEQHGRSAVFFDAKAVADRQNTDVATLVEERHLTWLSRKHSQRAISRSVDDLPERCTRLVLTVLSAKCGREALGHMVELRNDLQNYRYTEALGHLMATGGFYPESDARSKHTEIRALVRGLCAAGNSTDARRAIEAYFMNFCPDDSRVLVAKGDCLRVAAKTDPSLEPGALECYMAAKRHTRFSGYIRRVLGPKMARLSRAGGIDHACL